MAEQTECCRIYLVCSTGVERGKGWVRGKCGPDSRGRQPAASVHSPLGAFQGEEGMKELGNMYPRWNVPRCKDSYSMSSYFLRKTQMNG